MSPIDTNHAAPDHNDPARTSFDEQGYTPEDQVICASVRAFCKRMGGRLPSSVEYREILTALGYEVSPSPKYAALLPANGHASPDDGGYTDEDRRLLAAVGEYRNRTGRRDLDPAEYRAVFAELGYATA